MKSPLASVVIPVYNGDKLIQETIDSVLQQTYGNFEILIIDDGSTDNVRARIEKIELTDNRIKYYRQENSGVSSARNLGFNLSRGSLLAFLDADDVWLSNNLLKKVEKISQGDFGLVHSDGQLINADSIPIGEVMTGREGFLVDQLLAWRETQVPGPSSILVRREVIEKVGLFDTNLSTSADHDFFIRVASQFRIGRISEVTWQYRIHGSNMHKNIPVMQKDVLYLYKKMSGLKFFRSHWFEQRCFANMYLILAASWAGDGHNILKGLQFGLKAIFAHPGAVVKILERILKKRIIKR